MESYGRGRVLRRWRRARIQLLAVEGDLIVHVVEGRYPRAVHSSLHRFDGAQLTQCRALPNACWLSVDRHGRILAYDTGEIMRKRARIDRVLDREGTSLLERALVTAGTLSPVRIDGGEGLYFLRGAPVLSRDSTRLCVLEGETVREVMRWDDEATVGTSRCAVLVGPGQIIRGYRLRSPTTGAVRIESYSLDEQRSQWVVPVDADLLALSIHRASRRLVSSLADGTIGTIDLDTGALVSCERLVVDDVGSVALSLAIRGDTVAIGTIDGRLLVCDL